MEICVCHIYYLLVIIIPVCCSLNWSPSYKNSETYNEPFDFVAEKDMFLLNNNADIIDWTSVSGSHIPSGKISYVLFGGNRPNNNGSFTSVYRKGMGIIKLCTNKVRDPPKRFNINFDCKTLISKKLMDSNSIYLGGVVRTIKFSKNVVLLYCDPLWYSEKSKKMTPQGKCNLILINSRQNMFEKREIKICEADYKPCVGGFSVDMLDSLYSLQLLFGLPNTNSTRLMEMDRSLNSRHDSVHTAGRFYYGYSVAFSGDKSRYASAPIAGENYPFVKINDNFKIHYNESDQDVFSGFGLSIDTLKLSNSLYGVIIGAPYASLKGTNIGSVYLACKGYPLDKVEPSDLVGVTKGNVAYFGFSVARLGDINSDGTEDFVVSAPNLGSDSQSPSTAWVFVLTTTPDCKIRRKPAQVIQRKGVVGTYGVAVSRGMDVDSNGYLDFFVTSMGGPQKPELFMMPPQVKVRCQKFPSVTEEKTENEEVVLKITMVSDQSIDLSQYKYQVSLDYDYLGQNKRLKDYVNTNNNNDPRFSTPTVRYTGQRLEVRFKLLKDILTMDLKTNPVLMAVRGVRPCKDRDPKNCYKENEAHVKWQECDQEIKFTQFACFGECVSDLEIKVKDDPKGSVFYYGDPKNYQRTLEINVSNNGPDNTPMTYILVQFSKNVMISKVECPLQSTEEFSDSGEVVKIVIKSMIDKKINDNDNVRVVVKFSLQPKLTSNHTMLNAADVHVQVWGVNKDSNLQNNNYSLSYNIIFKPQIKFSERISKSTVIDDRKKPPYLEPNSRVLVHQLGTQLHFPYRIFNNGPPLKNVTFTLQFPYQTKEGKILLYILNKVRQTKNEKWESVLPQLTRNGKLEGSCVVPPNIINPLNLHAMETHDHSIEKSKIKRLKRDATWAEENRRWKRSSADTEEVNKKNESDTETGDKSQNQTVDDTVIIRDKSIPINCWQKAKAIGRPVCVEVTCRLNDIPKNSVFDFDFHTWLFTETFFNNELNDVKVSVKFQSDLGQLPKGLEIVNNQRGVGPVIVTRHILYSQMKVKEKKRVPWWIYIVATVIGVFILAIIISIAYCLGFFKRKQLKKEMKELRAQPNKPESEALVK